LGGSDSSSSSSLSFAWGCGCGAIWAILAFIAAFLFSISNFLFALAFCASVIPL